MCKFYELKKEDGSIIVEACFIIPIVIVCIFFVMFLIFYYHDKLIIKSVLETGVLNAKMMKYSDSEFETGKFNCINLSEKSEIQDIEIQNNYRDFLVKNLQNKLLVSENIVMNIDINDSRIIGEVKAKISFLNFNFINLENNNFFISEKVIAGINNKIEWVRRCMLIE